MASLKTMLKNISDKEKISCDIRNLKTMATGQILTITPPFLCVCVNGIVGAWPHPFAFSSSLAGFVLQLQG